MNVPHRYAQAHYAKLFGLIKCNRLTAALGHYEYREDT